MFCYLCAVVQIKREIALPPPPPPTIQPIMIPGIMENQQNNTFIPGTTINQQYMTNVMTPGTIENQQYMAAAYQANQATLNGGNQSQPLQQNSGLQSFTNTQQPSSGNQIYPQF